MNRRYKTAAKNRDTYKYFHDDGTQKEVTPEEVGSDLIILLFSYDDEAVDADRREDYHCKHYEGFCSSCPDYSEDYNPWLADEEADPWKIMLEEIEREELKEKLKLLMEAVEELNDLQKTTVQKKFWEGKTNVQIAAEEGVSEAAIRNRLEKIMKKLRKILQKRGSNHEF